MVALTSNFLASKSSGRTKELIYLILDNEENYLKFLSEKDILNIIPFGEARIINNIRKFIPVEYTLTVSLEESRKNPRLRDVRKLHFCIEDNHITEIEILLDVFSYSEDYYYALIQVYNLEKLREIALYKSYNIKKPDNISFYKTFNDISAFIQELAREMN
jgi:hypothetical protein